MTSHPNMGAALNVPLFTGLDRNLLSELMRHAEDVMFEAGQTLIERDEMGDAAFLVVTGRATQINELSTLHPYEFVKPGALVGEMAMLIETQHHLTVVADEPVRAIKFTRAMVQDQMAKDPRIADHFVQRIASRLQNLAADLRAADSKKPTAPPAHTGQSEAHPGDAHSSEPLSPHSSAPSTFPVN